MANVENPTGSVYVSYNWREDSSQLVDEICDALHDHGIDVRRDLLHLNYRDSIGQFMKRLGHGHCVIVVLTSSYLKSASCVFELLEIADNGGFEQRVFPIFMSDANLNDIRQRIAYIEHWHVEAAQVTQLYQDSGIGPAHTGGVAADAELILEIRSNIDSLMTRLKDMNALTVAQHREGRFDVLAGQLKEALRKTPHTYPTRPGGRAGGAPAGEGEPRGLSIGSLVDQRILIEDRTRGFLGREFVFRALDRFLENNTRGFFLLKGEPGIGKTSVAARLTQIRSCVHHFNVQSEGICTTELCQTNLCHQLFQKYDLPTPPGRFVPDAELLKRMMEHAGRKCRDAGEALLIIIDALDEVDLDPGAPAKNVLQLPRSLPDNVYVLLTHRQGAQLPLVIDCEREELTIQHESEENQRDVYQYLKRATARPGIQSSISRSGLDPVDFLAIVSDKSEGNFMYVRYVVEEIEHGLYESLHTSDLPQGLQGYYKDHWNRMRMGKSRDEWFYAYVPVITVLAAADKPISVDLIATFSGTKDRRRIPAVLSEWGQFLHKTRMRRGNGWQSRYSLYHASFRDFLRALDEINDSGVSLQEMDERILDSLTAGL